MVHPGHPSGACSTCKARRIKCDETRPHCVRCMKSNRACLGYHFRSPERRRTQNNVHTTTLQLGTCQPPIADFGYGLLRSPVDTAGHITAHFGENFILTPSRQLGDASLGFLDGLESVLTQSRHYSMLQNVMDVFAISHRSLWEGVQTPRQRNQQFRRYQQAIRDVKQSMLLSISTRSLIVSVFLLALFEMLVNSCPFDKTWQTHLNGLLILSRQRTLLQIIHPVSKNISHALQLLDDLQARFHYLSPELNKIFSEPAGPRKIDVQKLRIAVKRIFRELILARSVITEGQLWYHTTSSSPVKGSHVTSLEEPYLAFSWNKLQAILIASAIFLQESGEYLHTGNSWRETVEFGKITRAIQEAVTAICRSAAICFGEDFSQSLTLLSTGPCFFRTIDGLLWMWPLYVASKAPEIQQSQQQWVKNTLLGLGQIGRIPKAAMLAQTEEDRLDYYEFSSAITLLNLGFIVTHPST